MDLIFNQDDRFFAHDGVDPAPGDDDPKDPSLEEVIEDEFGDLGEAEGEDEDDDDEDDEDDPFEN